MIAREKVEQALREVMDPELHSSLVELNMVQRIEIDGSEVRVRIALTTKGCPLKDHIAADVREKLEALPGVEKVHVEMTEMSDDQRAELSARS